jgi:oxygen-independent coproporphyrinogen-3 oxidase
VGYALPGHACTDNVDLMEETGHVLACGAGAISKRVDPAIGRIERAPNVSEIQNYIDRTGEMLERKRALWAETWD